MVIIKSAIESVFNSVEGLNESGGVVTKTLGFAQKKIASVFNPGEKEQKFKWSVSLLSVGGIAGICVGLTAIYLSSAFLTAIAIAIFSIGVFVSIYTIYDIESKVEFGEHVDNFCEENDRLDQNVQNLTAVKDGLEDALKNARKEKEDLQTAFETVNRDLEQSSQSLAESVKKLEVADEELDKLKKLIDRVEIEMESFAKNNIDNERIVDSLGESVSSLFSTSESLKQSVIKQEEVVARAEKNTSLVSTLEEKIRGCFLVFSDYASKTAKQLKRLEDANTELRESSKRYSAGAEAFKQGGEQLLDAVPELTSLCQRLTEAVNDLANSDTDSDIASDFDFDIDLDSVSDSDSVIDF